MALFDKTQFDCLEAFRRELFENNRDVADRCTPGAPLLHTLAEVCALIGLPIDLTLSQDELIDFIWDLTAILRRRGTLVIGNELPEAITDTVKALQNDLLSDVLHEFATGIIVTDDRIAVAPAMETTEEKKVPEFTGFVDVEGKTLH